MAQKKKKIFLSGIGGSGMSALARYHIAEGNEVFGSDISKNERTKKLEDEGVTIFYEQKAENITENNFDEFIYTEAIEKTNLEFLAAKKQNIPSKKYFEALGEISKNHYTIAVSGTHGKSSTVAMLATILRDAGNEVTALVGADIHDWGGVNFLKANVGASEGMPTKNFLVLEACEYRDSFLNIEPNSIIVTNTELDHLDYFKNEEQYFESFQKFLSKLPQFGSFISFLKGENIMKILPANFHPRKFAVEESQADVPTLQVMGNFQKLNAACALEAAKAYKVDEKVAIKSLEQFKGLARRFDIKGEKNNILVVDDYAHHPTSLKMSIHSAREYIKTNKRKKLWVIFQPHQVSRTLAFYDEFVSAFKEADEVLIPNVYEARDTASDISKFDIEQFALDIEKHITELEKKKSNVWGRGTRKRGEIFYKKQARYTKDFATTLEILDDYAYDGDVILCIGAGNIHEISQQFLDS